MKKTINHNGIEVIDLDSIRSAKYDETIERLGEHMFRLRKTHMEKPMGSFYHRRFFGSKGHRRNRIGISQPGITRLFPCWLRMRQKNWNRFRFCYCRKPNNINSSGGAAGQRAITTTSKFKTQNNV